MQKINIKKNYERFNRIQKIVNELLVGHREQVPCGDGRISNLALASNKFIIHKYKQVNSN